MLRAQAAAIETAGVDPEWSAKVERLSRLCEEGVSKTHIAFLGTVLLAKALDRNADLYAIKPKLAKGNDNAFSARSLCHGVLVPLAAELGISLGVTGREPLNNQPYFRMTRLGDATPVHGGGRAAFNYMLKLVEELQEAPNGGGWRRRPARVHRSAPWLPTAVHGRRRKNCDHAGTTDRSDSSVRPRKLRRR